MSKEHRSMAFAVWAAHRIVDADGVLDHGEFSLFGQLFSRLQLQQMGFLADDGNFTDGFYAHLEASKTQLNQELDQQEKLDLMTLLHGTAVADGDLDMTEVPVLTEAAQLLGVDTELWMAHVQRVTG